MTRSSTSIPAAAVSTPHPHRARTVAPPSTLTRLATLAGGAPPRNPDVRTLARYAANVSCQLATVGFAARVDFDKVLANTRFAAPYGQSRFAFRRGNRFEDILRGKDGNYAALLGLFADQPGYDLDAARVENVRKLGRKMAPRATRTEELVAEIVAGSTTAPNLIDGAVLARTIGGVTAHFEADAVATRFAEPVHVGEVKSFPTVDGQADPDKVGAAISQVSIYILLLRDLVDRLGGDPDLVSNEALLITPRNTSLQPTLTRKKVGHHVERAERILASVDTVDLSAVVDADIPGFGSVADTRVDEEARLDALHEIAEHTGIHYQPSCLASCGLARFCRECVHEKGEPDRVGGQLVRLLPGIRTIDRAAELAHGAEPRDGEAPAAAQLNRAASVRDHLLGRHSTPTRRRRPR